MIRNAIPVLRAVEINTINAQNMNAMVNTYMIVACVIRTEKSIAMTVMPEVNINVQAAMEGEN